LVVVRSLFLVVHFVGRGRPTTSIFLIQPRELHPMQRALMYTDWSYGLTFIEMILSVSAPMTDRARVTGSNAHKVPSEKSAKT
jgi:hypothetical protein